MTIKPTITASAIEEPRADIAPAGTTPVSVQVNFELREAAAPGDDPRAAFAAFLDALPPMPFAAYRRAPGATELTLAAPAWLPRIGEAPAGAARSVEEWLAKPTVKAGQAPVWDAERAAEGELLGDPARLSAGQRLSGSQTWPAPLPHRAGLTQLVALPQWPAAPEMLYIVPFISAAPDAPPGSLTCAQLDEGVVEILLATGAWGDVPFQIAPAELQPTDLPLLDPESGFLKLDRDGFALVAFIRKLRQSAGSLFWLAPHLAGAASARDEARDRRIIWRAANTLCTLVDPLFLTLAMPDSDRREGPLVGAILAEAAQSADAGGAPTAEQQRTFTAAVKAWVKGRSAIGTAADRKAFVELLATLLDRPALTEWLDATDVAVGRWTWPFLNDLPALLPPLLRLFLTHAPWPADSDLEDIKARIDQELAALIEQMGSEDGFEAAILRGFGKVAPLSDAMKALVGGDDVRRDAMLDALGTHFSMGYNALEAARQAQGSLFANQLLAAYPAAGSAELGDRLLESRWFAKRLGIEPGDTPFGDLLAHVPRLTDYTVPDLGKLPAQLDAVFADACADIGARDVSNRRFVPDTHPLDLSIRLPVGLGNMASSFGDAYDGIALLVRRAGDAQWAHVNLTRFKVGTDLSPVAILPMQPAQLDGEYQLAHSYAGKPFAFAPATLAGEDDSYPPYFSVSAFDDEDDAVNNDWPAGYAKPAALAYGRRFEVAAFVISRGGVLPSGASRDPAEPDGHLFPAEVPEPGDQYVEFDYSRTTGIGRTVIEKAAVNSGAADPFKPPLDLIQPLTTDYPRQLLSASDGELRWLDLWRGPDGSGTIRLPAREGESLPLDLHDVIRNGGGDLFLTIEQDPQRVSLTGDALKLPAGVPAAGDMLSLTMERNADGLWLNAGGEKQKFVVDAEALGWVRIALHAPAAQSAALALADTQGVASGKAGGTRGAPEDMMVLRPNALGWSTAFAPRTAVRLLPPSMGYEDFDRWLANGDLKAAASGAYPGLVDDFVLELIAAREDLAAGAGLGPAYDAIAGLFERHPGVLPDLAVDKLVVELTLVDALGAAAWAKPLCREIVKIDPLGVLLHDIGYTQGHLDRSFERLAERRRIEVQIEAGVAPTAELVRVGRGLIARIPEGCAARLSVRPAVRGGLFSADPPVIAQGLRQHARGQLGDGSWLFDGTAMTVEVMDGHGAVTAAKLVQLTNEGLAVEAASTSRHYELTLDPKTHALWRHLGTAEVASQRWRHLGRPIYSWFDPHKHQHGPDRSGNAILRLHRSDPVASFEAEAFEGEDAQTEAVRLDPLGSKTRLHSGSWDAPSATIFRHRLTLRGRYAGALTDPALQRGWSVVGSYERSLPEREEWIRVAVLGDRSRIQVARPQLRLLMPLNRSSDEGITPPILAMLAEPPFAHGGLADRIGTGLAISTGYAMKVLPAAEGEKQRRLSVGDLRAEAGADPQISYRALEEALAQRLYLEAEGPIGLTFDRDSGTAAAFPNSAWALFPRLLPGGKGKADWQEHFLGVSMRRYLDPSWLAGAATGNRAGDGAAIPFGETRWIEVRDSARMRYDRDVLEIERHGQDWTVAVYPQAILPEDPYNKPIPMSAFGRGSEGIGLLHQPLDKGSAVLSVFALQPEGTLPRLLGSIQWRCGDKPDAMIELAYTGGGAAPAGVFTSTLTTASLPTLREWTRTGRNSAAVLATIKGSTASAPYPAARLSIQSRPKEGGGFATRFVTHGDAEVWLRPSLHDAQDPLYLQRCLALLQTELAPGKGRALELFGGQQAATLLFGNELKLAAASGDALTRVVELEMPARPVTSVETVKIELKEPEFDLEETGQGDAKTVLLLIKPFKDARAMGGYRLPLKVSALGATLSFPFNLPAGKSPQQIIIVQGADAGRAWYVDQDGELSAPLNGVVGPGAETASVKVAVDPTDSPWWGDVSVLTLPKDQAHYPTPHALPMSFDWLFGNADAEFETALTHAALRDLAGAQARIITVSPLIRRLIPDP